MEALGTSKRTEGQGSEGHVYPVRLSPISGTNESLVKAVAAQSVILDGSRDRWEADDGQSEW